MIRIIFMLQKSAFLSRRIADVGEQLCAKIVNDTVATVNHNANVVMRSYCAQSLEINK